MNLVRFRSTPGRKELEMSAILDAVPGLPPSSIPHGLATFLSCYSSFLNKKAYSSSCSNVFHLPHCSTSDISNMARSNLILCLLSSLYASCILADSLSPRDDHNSVSFEDAKAHGPSRLDERAASSYKNVAYYVNWLVLTKALIMLPWR